MVLSVLIMSDYTKSYGHVLLCSAVFCAVILYCVGFDARVPIDYLLYTFSLSENL
jgi:hypothetical protein